MFCNLFLSSFEPQDTPFSWQFYLSQTTYYYLKFLSISRTPVQITFIIIHFKYNVDAITCLMIYPTFAIYLFIYLPISFFHSPILSVLLFGICWFPGLKSLGVISSLLIFYKIFSLSYQGEEEKKKKKLQPLFQPLDHGIFYATMMWLSYFFWFSPKEIKMLKQFPLCVIIYYVDFMVSSYLTLVYNSFLVENQVNLILYLGFHFLLLLIFAPLFFG